MRSVDTNVLIRLLTRDDARQAAAADAFVARGAWVSHLVLAETTWVLASVYERSPKELAGAIDQLLDHEQLVLQDPDVVRAAVVSFRKRPSLSFSDCLIVEIARKAGHAPVGTFDRDLAKLEHAERVRP
jgi:predicted nucleic-acid-binding protein